MTAEDALRWDNTWKTRGASTPPPSPPRAFADLSDWFPTSGRALELACGTGASAHWMAQRGMQVHGVDVSPVAIAWAVRAAGELDVAGRCSFAVHDLDRGLPDTEPVDLLLCHLFRDPRLDAALVDRVRPGGLIAVAALSEVGSGPGRFRAKRGALLVAFSSCEVVDHRERDGVARILARRPERRTTKTSRHYLEDPESSLL